VPGLTAYALHQLAPEQAEPVARAGRVVFVDASVGQAAEPGIAVREIRADPKSTGQLGHVSDPGVILYLAETLYGRHPEWPAWLVTIPALDLEHGEGLSGPARAGVEAALVAIARLLELPAVGHA
jgi:Ni,Fe-hydrogenase maturation factor